MKIAVVGATGLVGTMMLKVLEERKFNVTELIPVASEKSVNKELKWGGNTYRIHSIKEAIDKAPHIALFSAGGSTSLQWAPEFAKVGTTVIDNSSAWRMHPDIKLIIPEINAHLLSIDDKIIANPNCSTIQMVMALHPLHLKYVLKRVVVSTYQSVTGTGAKAVLQMENERKGIAGEMAYPYPIDKNAIPQIDVFTESGYTKEELKMVNETKKIMGSEDIAVTATCVRIPVLGGHSESVNAAFEHAITRSDVIEQLNKAPGVVVIDNPPSLEYPMPLVHAHNRDEVFVGRIREDNTFPNTINMWIVSDNLRKGAATNAVQIAEYLVKNNLV